MSHTLVTETKKLDVDKHGYLRTLSDWNEVVAEALAHKEGVSLRSEHWELIHLLREFHQQSELIPSTRVLVKLIAKELGAEKGTSLYLMSLFPETPLKLICKISGLPRPTNCV